MLSFSFRSPLLHRCLSSINCCEPSVLIAPDFDPKILNLFTQFVYNGRAFCTQEEVLQLEQLFRVFCFEPKRSVSLVREAAHPARASFDSNRFMIENLLSVSIPDSSESSQGISMESIERHSTSTLGRGSEASFSTNAFSSVLSSEGVYSVY